MLVTGQNERIPEPFPRKGPFPWPKVKLDSWEPMHRRDKQLTFRTLLSLPWQPVTQASVLIPNGHMEGEIITLKWPLDTQKNGPKCIRMKCIQPIGSYTITVSKIAIDLLVVIWKDSSLPLRINWRLHPSLAFLLFIRLFLFWVVKAPVPFPLTMLQACIGSVVCINPYSLKLYYCVVWKQQQPARSGPWCLL